MLLREKKKYLEQFTSFTDKVKYSMWYSEFKSIYNLFIY